METRDEAEALKGGTFFGRGMSWRRSEEGEYFYHQLLGMTVVTVEGEEIGEIVEVYEIRPADLLEVRGLPRPTSFPSCPPW